MVWLVHEQGKKKDISCAVKEAGLAQRVHERSTSSRHHYREDERPSHGEATYCVFSLPAANGQESREFEDLAAKGSRMGVCFFLTIDAPTPRKQEADERILSDQSLRSGMSGASGKNDAKGGALGRIMNGCIDASISWEDIFWIRDCVPGVPIVLRGVKTSENAILTMQAGIKPLVSQITEGTV
jgi:L-lactate dehydrogenase (cytochrome)